MANTSHAAQAIRSARGPPPVAGSWRRRGQLEEVDVAVVEDSGDSDGSPIRQGPTRQGW